LGNNIYALHLTQGTVKKPTFVLECGFHAREWIAPTTCCWIIAQLLTHPELLARSEWVVIPVLNVDGYDYTHTNDRLWRKNRQPNSGSSCVGTDLNRNFPYAWSGPGASGNPCSETYYGTSPFSAVEVAALRNLMTPFVAENRLISHFDIHSYGSMWMSPWEYTCNSLPSDYPAMAAAMQAAVTAVQAVNGNYYDFGSVCRVIYQTSGGSCDYTYGDGGVVHSYGLEAFGNNFTPAPSYIEYVGSEIWAGVYRTALEIL